MSPPEDSDSATMCQTRYWSRADWNPKLQLYRAMYGGEMKTKEIHADGCTSMQKTVTFMTVHEHHQYMSSLYPFSGAEKYMCTGPMYTSRPMFSVNNNIMPAKTRQTCEYHLTIQKTFIDKPSVLVLPPPPGLLITPKMRQCNQYCAGTRLPPEPEKPKPSVDENEDLDINGLIEEFRIQTKVHEEYESVFFLRKFFIDCLDANFVPAENENSESIYRYLLQGASSEKIAEITYEFLRRFGFEAFLKLQNVSRRFYNILASDICCNELLSSEVIAACNFHAKSKKRMEYTKMF